MTDGDPVEVQVETHQGLRCACGLEPLLQADMPDPDAAGGRSCRTLCPACDADSVTGRALLAWFATHPVVEEDDVEEFGRLLQRWLEDVSPADIDAAELDAARLAWQPPA